MNQQHLERRKLIEVALPLEAINKASAREKSIRHGHPSTLHCNCSPVRVGLREWG
jgi:putative DNA methylase